MELSEHFDDLPTDLKVPPKPDGHISSINVSHRDERYKYMHAIQIIVNCIKSQLGRPKEEQPKGSNKLKPLKVIHKTCKVEERIVCDIHLYDIKPHKYINQGFSKRIYYFCGGGWQSPPSGQHWQVCAKLARQIPETAITLVSIPLAPKNPAPVTFPWLMKLYRELLRQSEEEGHRLILAGDSSGANVILSLALEALREDNEEKIRSDDEWKHIAHPVALLVISPSTDLTRTNPEIEKLKSVDPILTPEFIISTAKAWVGDWDPTDRRVSPINADISLLAKRGIKVHGITSGYDILRPDAIIFRDKLAEAGVKGEWLDWDKQMHCFVLTWPYGMREGREAIGWIVEVLKKE